MNKKRNHRKLIAGVMMAVTIVVASVMISSAGSSLLSVGSGSKIIAGSSFDFSLNLSSFAPDEEEELSGSGFDYVVSLSVTGDISQLSVAEGVGSVNAVSGYYEVNYSELGGDNKLNFTVTPSADITEETNYTVKVEITGSRSGSDSFSFVAVPAVTEEEDSTENSEDTDSTSEDSSSSSTDSSSSSDDSSSSDSSSSSGSSSQSKKSQQNKKSGGKQSSKKSGSSGSGSSSSSSSSVTYAGSWDNYLDELSVDGYEFTQKFNKIRDTYFLTVPDTVTSLTVNATASDSSAYVAVAGNSELSGSQSKIMVSVTADDDSVRVYRIYVTRLSEEEIAAAEEAEKAEEEASQQGRGKPGDGEMPQMGEGNMPPGADGSGSGNGKDNMGGSFGKNANNGSSGTESEDSDD